MGRSARSALPHPSARANAGGVQPQRVVNRPDGGVAEVSGPPITSLPDLPKGNGPDKMVVSSNLGSNPGGEPVMSVIDEDAPASPPIPKYIVENEKEKNVSGHGYRFVIRPGKVVDATNYDLAELRRQGIKLRELSPAELASL